MRVTLSAVLAVLAMGIAFAATDAKVKINLAPKVGTSKYKFEIKTELQGQDVHVGANLQQEVKSVEKDLAKVSINWEGLKITLGAGEQDVPASAIDLEYAVGTGLIKSVSGGIDGTDQQRMYAVMHFLPPKDEIGEGESYTVEVKQSTGHDSEVPAYKIVGKYIGKVDVDGKSAYKFTAKYSEAATDSMEADTTFFVNEDGVLLKAESVFKKMPLPKFGTTLDGKMSVSLSK